MYISPGQGCNARLPDVCSLTYYQVCNNFMTTIRCMELNYFRFIQLDPIDFVLALNQFNVLQELYVHQTANSLGGVNIDRRAICILSGGTCIPSCLLASANLMHTKYVYSITFNKYK